MKIIPCNEYFVKHTLDFSTLFCYNVHVMKNKKRTNSLNFLLMFLCICIAFFATHSFLVQAADDPLDEKLDDTYSDLEEITKKINETQDILNLKQKERQIINTQIQNIENESLKVEKDIEETEQEIEELTREIDRIKNEIIQKESHITLQKKILEKFLREKYQKYSKNSEYFTTLNIANINQQNHRDSLGQTTEGVSDFVKKIHSEQEALKKDQVILEKKSTRITDAKYELEQRNAHLQSTQDYKRVLAAEVAAEENKYQQKLSKLEKEQLEIQQEISSLSAGYIGEFSLKDLPDAKDADFDKPIEKPYVITQNYGVTSFSHNYSTGAHNGIDFVAQGSQNIQAVADGKVKATGNMGNYGYGKWIAIDHGNGLVTLYGHLSSQKVSRGDKVDKGDKIGVMGNTGYSTGTHLHFSVFAQTTFGVVESSSVSGIFIPTGATVNPAIYL